MKIDRFKDFKLNESGFSRIKNILTGHVPSIYTIGIITWENPLSKEASPEYNKEANKKLEQILRDGMLGFNKIKGMYDKKPENPFLIRNISKNALCLYGYEGKQTSVIFGEKIDSSNINNFNISKSINDKNYIGMNFKLINTENKDKFYVMSERNVIINRNDYTDAYSEYKGKKFQIPFFDTNVNIDKEIDYIQDNFEIVDQLNLSKYKTDLTKEELKTALDNKDTEYYVIIDEIYNDIYQIKTNKKRIISYQDAYIDSKGELKNTVQTQVQPQMENYEDWDIDDVILLEELSKKSTKQVGFGAWVTRGRIQQLMRKYDK
jgi:hypothetical protein